MGRRGAGYDTPNVLQDFARRISEFPVMKKEIMTMKSSPFCQSARITFFRAFQLSRMIRNEKLWNHFFFFGNRPFQYIFRERRHFFWHKGLDYQARYNFSRNKKKIVKFRKVFQAVLARLRRSLIMEARLSGLLRPFFL